MTELQGFCNGDFELPSKNIDAQRCLNLIPEKTESGTAKAQVVLLNSPGFDSIYDLTDAGNVQSGYAIGDIRQGGLYVTSDDRLIVVAGYIILCFTSLTETSFEPMAYLTDAAEQGWGPVTVIDNGTILFIQSWGKIYTWSLSDLTTPLVTPTWLTGGFSHITYINARFYINSTLSGNERNMYGSPLDWNGTDDWDPLVTKQAETSPDNIDALITVGRDTWVFGKNSYEIWYDASDAPFPLNPNVSLAYRIGIVARYSLASTQNKVFWLGSGQDGFGRVFTNSGYQPQRISTNGLEASIASYGYIEDAIGYTYQELGHAFYVITFQSGNKTWAYDITTGLWAERSSYPIIGTTPVYDSGAWRPRGTTAFQSTVIGYDNIVYPSIIQVSSDIYTEDLKDATQPTEAVQILRLRSCPHIYSGLNRIFYKRFQLDMQTGVGISSPDRSEAYEDLTQGVNPMMRMRYSNDGGYTWSNFILAAIGRIGTRLTRLLWNRLGSARDRVFEFSTTEPIPIRIMGAWIDVEEGNS